MDKSADPDAVADPGDDYEDDEADDEAGRRLLAQLYGQDGPPDLEALAGPTRWPEIPAVDIAAELGELRGWVEELLERFPHLDHTVIPACWWRHNGHVEALQALRDHERVSYADSSPATAGVDWHRAFLLIEARLREWTGWSGCASGHKEPIPQLRRLDAGEWENHIRQQVERRQRREIDSALR